jgi:hypothetical protein
MSTVANLAMDLTNTACAHAGPVAVRVDKEVHSYDQHGAGIVACSGHMP